MQRNTFLVLICLTLVGCSAGLPNRERSLREFILEKQTPENQIVQPSTSVDDWVSANYPVDCEWHDFKRIVDGDTIIVNDDDRVRMIGIDTPESKKENTPIQAYSLDASRQLKSFLSGEEKVCLITDEEGDAVDIYGRWLRYVFTDEGLDANAEMIKSGLAEGYLRFPFERKEAFRQLESEAKKQKVGQWSQ